jgi:hypothetical protein
MLASFRVSVRRGEEKRRLRRKGPEGGDRMEDGERMYNGDRREAS